jgi:hypothetical protein
MITDGNFSYSTVVSDQVDIRMQHRTWQALSLSLAVDALWHDLLGPAYEPTASASDDR